MLTYLLVGIVGVVLVYFIFIRQTRQVRLLRKLPGPPTWPILGSALELNVPSEEFMRILSNYQSVYGNRVYFQLGHKHYVCIMEAKDVEKIMSSYAYIDKSDDYDWIKPWLGTGLLISQGQKWFYRRKLLTPTFHFKILEDFLDVFNEQATTLVELLKKEFKDNDVFDVFPYVARCALDIICETAMGKKVRAQQNKESEYVTAVYRIGDIIQHRMTRPWLHLDFLWKLSTWGREEAKLLPVLHRFTENVIAEKKREYLLQKRETKESKIKITDSSSDDENVYTGGKRRVAFLDLLLNAQAESEEKNYQGPPLTDLDIREETDTFMFEGHDTTAANVSFTIFLLGCNPECQKKVQEELSEIFGSDNERPLTTKDLSRMKYMECCIKESLRLYPSVPIIGRAIKTDLELDDGIIIPPGTVAFLAPYQLHRNPAVFPEPEEFRPERFFPENSIGRNPYAYVPFSAGPRNCIGQKFAIMEEKVILASIFRNFKVEAAQDVKKLIIIPELIVRSKNGLHVKLTRLGN